jgi:hypothetical protein
MFEFIPAAEQVVRERAKNEALAEQNNKTAANVDYIAMMCDIDLENGGDISDVLAAGDHFIANDTEYVFEGVTESGDLIAAEADSGREEGGADEQ